MKERITTGIDKLDSLMGGGIPKGNVVILAGGAGAGKSLFCFQFLYKNAKKGLKSAFISLEETPKQIIDDAIEAFSDFSDAEDLINKNSLIINGEDILQVISNSAFDDTKQMLYLFNNALASIYSIILNNNVSVAVIDSVTIFKNLISDPISFRLMSMKLINILKKNNITALLTLEVSKPYRDFLEFPPEFFIYDGVIGMYFSSNTDSRIRTLEIVKMRGTSHSTKAFPYEITSSGIDIVEI
ncbi:MAG: circadian clock protein KaiC [Candidatus Micrarchaeota archaeon]|nr:MAG: circadian clock protein KaiC [Candidatus Micrarchaeota archaeon]